MNALTTLTHDLAHHDYPMIERSAKAVSYKHLTPATIHTVLVTVRRATLKKKTRAQVPI